MRRWGLTSALWACENGPVRPSLFTRLGDRRGVTWTFTGLDLMYLDLAVSSLREIGDALMLATALCVRGIGLPPAGGGRVDGGAGDLPAAGGTRGAGAGGATVGARLRGGGCSTRRSVVAAGR